MANLERSAQNPSGKRDEPFPRLLENKLYKPGIGGLGEPQYQPESLRIKSFCGEVIQTAEQYRQYLETQLFPAAREHQDITRIIDRVIIKAGLFLPSKGLEFPIKTEAAVHLGGRWEGYDWAMNGASLPGRQLTDRTRTDLLMQAAKAKDFTFSLPQELPPGFLMEKLSPEKLTAQDMEDLAEIFRLSFNGYLTPLEQPDQVEAWINGENMYPIGVRNAQGKIVVVANGDIARMTFGNQEFRFFEIGDSAGHPDYRNIGMNRLIKHHLLSEAAKMDFDSIHTETRAAWTSPNIGNAKNGMVYGGTLWSNCQISGPEDVFETADPQLNQDSRRMGSLNIWSMTQRSPLWEYYRDHIDEPPTLESLA